MPLRNWNSKVLHRRTYGGNLERVTLLKRGDDQAMGTVTRLTLFQCLLPTMRVEGRIKAVSESFYSGQAVKVLCDKGSVLEATINHPALTPRGFLPVGSLKPGDCLVTDEGRVDVAADDVQYAPPTIQQTFQTFLELPGTLTRHSSRPFEFHGDGCSMKGQVNIVNPHWELLRNWNFQRTQGSSDYIFDGSDSPTSDVETFSEGSFPRERSSLFELPVGRCNLTFSLVGGHLTPFELFGFRRGPHSNFSVCKYADNCFGTDAESSAKGERGFPGRVALNNFFFRFSQARPPIIAVDSVHLGHGSEFDTCRPEPSLDSLAADSVFLSELLGRFPGRITTNKIINIDRFHYEGPVYDAETTMGYYTGSVLGSKLFLSNCRIRVRTHTGEPLLRTLAAGDRSEWMIPRCELDRVGVAEINALDRIVGKDGQVWQPEAPEGILIRLFKNIVSVPVRRVKN